MKNPVPAKSGIYQIRNNLNGNIYIGSAVNYLKRFGRHVKHLRRGDHDNEHLQRAWVKYGEDHFVLEILEFVLDEALLLPTEQQYIDKLQPEYNICRIAGKPPSLLGRPMPEETKEKLRLALTGRPHSPERIARIREGRNAAWEARPELREVARRNQTGKRASEECKRKQSENIKRLRREEPWRWPKETRRCNGGDAAKKRSESLKQAWKKRKETIAQSGSKWARGTEDRPEQLQIIFPKMES